jgi:glutamate synthase (NADPH/NADH) large chain
MIELEELTAEDAAFLASLLDEHKRRTGSRLAVKLLTDWENTVNRVIKVVPLEYRRVLAELSAAREKSSPSAALRVVQAAAK